MNVIFYFFTDRDKCQLYIFKMSGSIAAPKESVHILGTKIGSNSTEFWNSYSVT